MSHSEGIYIYTKNGEKILDFTGGIGVLNHGHNHPRILKARQQFQSEKRMEVHRNYFSQYIAALSSNIATLLPGDLNYCFFQTQVLSQLIGLSKQHLNTMMAKGKIFYILTLLFMESFLDQKVLQTRQKISLIILEYQELFSLDLMILSLLKSKLIR